MNFQPTSINVIESDVLPSVKITISEKGYFGYPLVEIDQEHASAQRVAADVSANTNFIHRLINQGCDPRHVESALESMIHLNKFKFPREQENQINAMAVSEVATILKNHYVHGSASLFSVVDTDSSKANIVDNQGFEFK